MRHLKCYVQRIAGDLRDSQFNDKTIFYTLGHCLLLLNDLSSCCTAFEQAMSPDPVGGEVSFRILCDMCSSRISGVCYVCMTCADTDLCNTCMTEYKAGKGMRWCTSHKFLRVQDADGGKDERIH